MMGEIFDRCGTDKQSKHGYGPIYDVALQGVVVRSVLELGIAQGRSLLAWKHAFPEAMIVGIDLVSCEVAGAVTHAVDVRDHAALIAALKGYRFDLIVDDASHDIADQLACVRVLWPLLNQGGVYVVEDIDDLACTQLYSGWDVYHGEHASMVWRRKP